MRIVISLLNFRPGQIGGTETYLRGLLTHLAAVNRENDEIILLGHQGNAESLRTFTHRQVVLDKSNLAIVRARCMEAFTPLRARFAEQALARLKPDVVLFPQQSMFPKRVDCPSVLVVVDVQHLFLPHYFSLFDWAFRAAIYPFSLRRADKIIAISEWTRRTVTERCSVSPEKIVAIQPGTFPRPQVVPQAPIEAKSPYLYYPAATFQHKGHATLFRTYAAIRHLFRIRSGALRRQACYRAATV